jgi:hypothetical protein
LQLLGNLHALLYTLRTEYGMEQVSDLQRDVILSIQPRRPVSYKLENDDIEWLVWQRQNHPELTGPQLQAELLKERGKKIGDHAINTILRKKGLARRRGR